MLVSSADETAFAVRDAPDRPRAMLGPTPPSPASDPRHVFFTCGTASILSGRSARGSSVPRSARSSPGSGADVELTVLGCSGSYGGAGRRRVQRLPAAVGRHVGLGRLRQRHLRRTCRSTSRSRTSPRSCSPTATPTTASTSTACTCCCATASAARTCRSTRPRASRSSSLSLVSDWGNTFDWRVVGDGDTAEVGDIDLRFSRTDHPPPTYAVEATADGRRMIYTADTGPELDGGRVRRPAPTSCCPRPPTSTPTSPRRSTSRPSRPARRRARRRAQRLILTHLWPMIDRVAAVDGGLRGVRRPASPWPRRGSSLPSDVATRAPTPGRPSGHPT